MHAVDQSPSYNALLEVLLNMVSDLIYDFPYQSSNIMKNHFIHYFKISIQRQIAEVQKTN